MHDNSRLYSVEHMVFSRLDLSPLDNVKRRNITPSEFHGRLNEPSNQDHEFTSKVEARLIGSTMRKPCATPSSVLTFQGEEIRGTRFVILRTAIA